MSDALYASPAPALDLEELDRLMGVVRATGPIPQPAEILLSPKGMAKLMPAQQPPPVQVYAGIPVRVSEWLGEDQWVALDSKGRVVMVNGQRVDPGPDIFGGLAGEDLIYPGRSR